MDRFGSRSRPQEIDRDRRVREERNGDRYRDRERSRSRSPGRRQEREWDRGKRRFSPPSSRYSDDNRDHERHDPRRPYSDEPPSRTIMLRGLPALAFEAEIRHILDPQIAAFVDIRVPRSLEGGNRGFGFVEFANVESASAWMEQVQGAVYIGETRVIIHFCEDREPYPKADRPPMTSRPAKPTLGPSADWECSRCGCNNFRHRATCFRCEALRSEAENLSVPAADEHVGLQPSNTLLLRSLDASTDENRVINALLSVMPNSSIKTAKIMRDPRTQYSAGYGFVQFNTQQDCTEMYSYLMRINPPLTIDGQQIAVSFAKQSLADILAPPNSQQSTFYPNSAYIASGPAPPSMRQVTGYGQGNDANSAAAVAQQALQQLQKSQMSAAVVQQHLRSQNYGGQSQVPAGYVYDPNSGYYYDANSGLYYDAKTQYFWNPSTQQYLAWNAQTQNYVVVPHGGQAAASQAPPIPPSESEEKLRIETEKEKQAKRVMAEMEKWAKSQNQKQPPAKKFAPPEIKIGAVASVFSEPQEEEVIPDEVQKNLSYKTITIAPPKAPAVPLPTFADRKNHGPTPEPEVSETDSSRRSGSPAALSGPSENIKRQQAAEEKLVDWERLACLLCKRQLNTRELLEKHLEMSDLHSRNLDAHRRQTMTDAEIEELEERNRSSKYRDRARERREKYGETEPAPPLRGATAAAAAGRKRGNPSESAEAESEDAPAPGLGSDNVGAKLMKKLGWSEGHGLGKSKQGIVDPVEARSHSGTTGLGLSEGAPDILPTDTYASKVRKTMRNRFRQMQE